MAQQAGVSLATASRVINGAGARLVRPDLHDRVVAAALELGYVANAHAQALAAGGSSIVGLVTHDVSDPYFAAISRGAMRVATERGLLVVLGSTLRDPERELAYVSALRGQRARAILLLGSGFEDASYALRMRQQLDTFAASGGRVALVSEHGLPFDTVLPDNRAGAAALAGALIQLGHRRFAVVTAKSRLTTVVHRFRGFREAVLAGGGILEPGQVAEGDFNQEGGYAATVNLLDRGLTGTALFCVSDVMAIGALQALRERSVRVPEDLSVAGFDDIPIVAQLTPGLTTVALPLEQMGEQVLSMALGPAADVPQVRPAPARVVLRGTTASISMGVDEKR